MRVAFLSSLDPNNINHWSGTLYFIFQSLGQSHEVEWIGGDLIEEVRGEHNRKKRVTPFTPALYSRRFAEMIQESLAEYDRFDVIVARDCFFIAYLEVDIPIVYIGDTTFDLIKESWGITHDNTIRLLDEIEGKAFLNADCIIFSSQWAKENATTHYGVDPARVEVVEFGANMTKVPETGDIQIQEETLCNLLFIGKDWKRKGGNKAVETFNLLKKRNFNCALTIIGCNPDLENLDPDLRIIPFINKSQAEDAELLHRIMQTTHFLLFPTNFDCFGIVFCEASAYGIPSITADVAGVGQVVREEKNGCLLSPDAEAGEYADLIEILFKDKTRYRNLRKSSRKEFDKRLNWNVWGERVNTILKRFEYGTHDGNKLEENSGFYLPTYIIHLKNRLDRRTHIDEQFKGKTEFEIHYVDAIQHNKGTVGLWESMKLVIQTAMSNKDDIILLCEDDHTFTAFYNKEFLFRNIIYAEKMGAELLSGGISGFGTAVPATNNLYWVDWYWGNQFLVIFQPLFRRILDYEFKEEDMADLVLSALTMKKMVMYPFISTQREFGYSDINRLNEKPGYVTGIFSKTNERLSILHEINQFNQFNQL